ncbi:ABC transporter permease [Stieleria varia]|uniref:ABC-2 family transporter protein n=1 Tax=Stieleria varia TaxID=2528005 RepID=A0A5C6AZY6_9BACT|nr:hypothetical protein [Stieleria varia]TWU05595.1 hypothetical protein Pla52n_13100 [Stieleria varia]
MPDHNSSASTVPTAGNRLAEATLGGGDASRPYHSLALDPIETGAWGKVDVWSDRIGGWLNPILIKEARQSLKSKQFLVIFFTLLFASWAWTILGIVINSPDVYYTPTGQSLLSGYYLILAIPLMGLVPIVAFRSLAAELDDGTFEMLAITQLSATRIVWGKLNSAMLQMLIYFAAIVPCLAFSYLLRGISLPSILYLLAFVFGVAFLLTTFGLLLATLTNHRAVQTFTLLGLVGVIVFSQFLCGAFVLGDILGDRMSFDLGTLIDTSYFYAIGLSFAAMFLMAAAARIAPVTENRSTGLRWMMLIQQSIWILVMVALTVRYSDVEPINFGSTMIGLYWLIVGTLMLGESKELSPRVQRGLPRTYLSRMFLTWLYPGPGTGFMFAICSGCAGLLVLSAFGDFAEINGLSRRRNTTSGLIFAMIMAGYLLGYLSVIRLLTMPLARRFGSSFVLPLVIGLLVMFTALVTPLILHFMLTGGPPRSYEVLEAPNWAWTWEHAINRRFDPGIATLIFVVGAMVFAINLFFLFREFRYRRIAVPRRVLADEAVDAN